MRTGSDEWRSRSITFAHLVFDDLDGRISQVRLTVAGTAAADRIVDTMEGLHQDDLERLRDDALEPPLPRGKSELAPMSGSLRGKVGALARAGHDGGNNVQDSTGPITAHSA